MKNIIIFLSENFHFLVIKFSVCLNMHVFVMVLYKIKAEINASCKETGIQIYEIKGKLHMHWYVEGNSEARMHSTICTSYFIT